MAVVVVVIVVSSGTVIVAVVVAAIVFSSRGCSINNYRDRRTGSSSTAFAIAVVVTVVF